MTTHAASPSRVLHVIRTLLLLWLMTGLHTPSASAAMNIFPLAYTPAPADNPLKGFFPFAGSHTNFPHSMEYTHFPLGALMTGPTNFNWSPLEAALNEIAQRGHQAIFRIYIDYPTHSTGIPQFLLDAGLSTRVYDDYGNKGRSLSPDYENPLLRQALTNFIKALGERFDGDPRIGFITVGLLGFWGEWHTYPHTAWNPSIEVQNEVLDAFESAFTRTKFLVRQPYGRNARARRMGYHDDSFAFQTIDPPAWHFLGELKAAGETHKWQTQPIGGEVRPDIQPCMWKLSSRNCVPQGQEFDTCVKQTHASWMLNQVAFLPGLADGDKQRAIEGARLLGYELFVASAELVDVKPRAPLAIRLQIRNLGVAPFYYNWPMQLRVLDAGSNTVKTWTTDWKVSTLLPAATNAVWSSSTETDFGPGRYTVLLRVQNPLPDGKSIRFANTSQDADSPGWLTLGQFQILPNP
jgi:hypothetical protein